MFPAHWRKKNCLATFVDISAETRRVEALIFTAHIRYPSLFCCFLTTYFWVIFTQSTYSFSQFQKWWAPLQSQPQFDNSSTKYINHQSCTCQKCPWTWHRAPACSLHLSLLLFLRLCHRFPRLIRCRSLVTHSSLHRLLSLMMCYFEICD